MPVNGDRVSVMSPGGLSMVPQTFAAKAEADIATHIYWENETFAAPSVTGETFTQADAESETFHGS